MKINRGISLEPNTETMETVPGNDFDSPSVKNHGIKNPF